MNYRENSRFVHEYNNNESPKTLRGLKRPLAGGQNQYKIPSNQQPAYQRPAYSHPLGINQNTYGYGGGNMMGISYGHANESYEPESKIFAEDKSVLPSSEITNNILDTVFNKISENYNIKSDEKINSQTLASTNSSNVTNAKKHLTQFTTSSSSGVVFLKPGLPVSTRKPVKEPEKLAPNPKPAMPKHVSAKDMWEISYRKEVKKEVAKGYSFALNSTDTLVANEVIDIVPITENTDFIFEGIPHFYREKCEDKLTIEHCLICNQYFTTALQAKKHYKSGRHKNKLSSFLVSALEPGDGFDVESSSNSVEIVPKSKDKEANKKSSTNEIFCTLCNLDLGSQESAKAHFQGKSHKKKVKEFLGIHPDIINVPLKDPKELPTNTPPCLSWDEPPESGYCNTVRMCILCSVKASSLVSIRDHYAGKSHKKKIRLAKTNSLPTVKKFKVTQFVSGGTLSMETNRLLYEQYIEACKNESRNNSIFGAEATWLRPTYGKYQNCITPSGKFYCTICNLTLDSQQMLQQHEKTREHKLEKSRQKSIYQQ